VQVMEGEDPIVRRVHPASIGRSRAPAVRTWHRRRQTVESGCPATRRQSMIDDLLKSIRFEE
jgi:hypothetical protein